MKKLLIAVLAAVALVGCNKDEKAAEAAKRELHIYTWADYISPEVVMAFEKEYDCKIVIDTFDSNEAMYAKLKAGASGYDLMFPSSYMVGRMASEGMIEKLDHTKCPSVRKNFYEPYRKMLPEDPDLEYAAPYSSSPTILFYDPAKVPEGTDMATWQVLANPAFKGKITFLDDMREVIGAGLMSLGYSINSTDPAEVEAAVERVLEWKRNVRKFDSESYKNEVADGSTIIGQGFGQVARQVILGDDENPPRADLAYAYPREGFTESCEEMVVAKNAPNRDLAYALIEFLYSRPDMGVKNMEFVLGMLPCTPAIEALDEEMREEVVAKPEVMAKGQVILGIDMDPAVLELYTKAWDRIKAVK